MARRFARLVEDFSCEQCGAAVVGTGFTNHCPRCLYSKHVDVNPGDRAATCRGPMRPLSARYERGRFQVLHECEVCGDRRPNRAVAADNQELLIALMATPFTY